MFLNDAETLDAIERLSNCDELVLYCGAGVSIDRTGRPWRRLIRDISGAAADRIGAGHEIDNASIEYLLDNLGELDQFASLIDEYHTGLRALTVNDFLFPLLQDLLYRNTWSEGYVLRNTVQLALVAASLGKKVTILTTNYDVYIERRFEGFRDSVQRLAAATGTPVVFPELVRKVMISGTTPTGKPTFKLARQVELRGIGSSASIEIIYLHGRVPKAGAAAEGTIVLDERTYAETREGSSKYLKEYFGRDRVGVLILGASLTDKPLVQALIHTRASNASRMAIYADLPKIKDGSVTVKVDRSPDHDLTQSDIETAYRNRGKHLGISLLFPMAYFQTAQFLEELQLALRMRASGGPAYRDAAAGVRYSERLQKWAASRRTSGLSSTDAYTELNSTLNQIVRYAGGKLARKHLRLEVWLRVNPRSTDRTLYLYSSSAGPMLDDDVRRRESIRPGSNNASVRALLAGKPLVARLEDIGMPTDSTRWASFLSVPIFLNEEVNIGGDPYIGSIPAGVITLAGLEEAHLASTFEALPVTAISEILNILIAQGRAIAKP